MWVSLPSRRAARALVAASRGIFVHFACPRGSACGSLLGVTSPLSPAHKVLLALYVVGALALASLAFEAQLPDESAPQSHDAALQWSLLGAAFVVGSIGVGAFLRARWARPLALFLHGLVVAISALGLAGALLFAPLSPVGAGEQAGKLGVHATLLALWWSPWMRRALARDERQA